MKRLPRWAAWWLALVMLVAAGCASPPKPSGPVDVMNGPWSGRLALQVEDKPGQSFSAAFELKGNARAGELALFSPLGGTLAMLSWQPGKAMLQANGQATESESVDALVARVAGAAVPVAALFDWLRGIATPVAGWLPDLSQLAQGRLSAKRVQPVPSADLRVVLER